MTNTTTASQVPTPDAISHTTSDSDSRIMSIADRISRVRSIAVVSGKGGSGKTMIISAFAKALDEQNVPTVLIDSDVGTGGLSYYLGIKYAQGIGVGLSELLLTNNGTSTRAAATTVAQEGRRPSTRARVSPRRGEGAIDARAILVRVLRPLSTFSNTRFVSVGDLRKLQQTKSESFFSRNIGVCLNLIKEVQADHVLLIDCRGGIDEESLAVCRFVDDVIIIAETDPASFQATQNLANVLSDNGLSDKIRGFIINRAFDDPSPIVRNGLIAFGGQYLGSIPFDLEAIRNFHSGDLPSYYSIFNIHVRHAFARQYPDLLKSAPGQVWDFREYRAANVGDIYSTVGGSVIASVGAYPVVPDYPTFSV